MTLRNVPSTALLDVKIYLQSLPGFPSWPWQVMVFTHQSHISKVFIPLKTMMTRTMTERMKVEEEEGVEDGSDDDMWAAAGGGRALAPVAGAARHKCRTSEFRRPLSWYVISKLYPAEGAYS